MEVLKNGKVSENVAKVVQDTLLFIIYLKATVDAA